MARTKAHPLDTCDCGDCRKDHAGGNGGCKFTPDPDHDKVNDGHFGSGRCDSFRLARRHEANGRSV